MAQYGGFDNQGGYGQPSPYAQGSRHGQQQTSQPTYGGQQNGTYAGGNDMEMGAVNGRGKDPNAILDETREIDRGIETIEANLKQLQDLQKRALDDPDASQNTQTNRQIDDLTATTMNLYRNFTERIQRIRSLPASSESRNKAQVEKVKNKLRRVIDDYRKQEFLYGKDMRKQQKRQMLIVNPNLTEEELDAAVEDPSRSQVFQQALQSSNRRGQSQSTLQAVQGRSDAIRRIEQQMHELSRLFQQVDELVAEQDVPLQLIDEQGERVQEDVQKANVQLDTANRTARSRNKKKWICLAIAILILIIIVVIVVIVVKVILPNNK